MARLQQLPVCVKAQSQLHQQDLEESTLIQQLTTRQAERFRIQPERAAFTGSVGGTLIFVELAALEGPDLQNSTVAGQNLGVGYSSAPKTGHRRHAYAGLVQESSHRMEPLSLLRQTRQFSKRPMVWDGFPCANPLCPPTPFRNV